MGRGAALRSQVDARWDAVVRRDAAHDGAFYYSVSTTGVFCRPSCAARRPRREHVAFHDTIAAARAAGFRPCRRCAPGQPSLRERRARVVEGLCRWIEDADAPPSVDALAERAGWSPSHTHRVFKSITGVTPKAYIDGVRAGRVRAALQRGERVTDAIYTAGYGSPSRFYDQAEGVLGMSPSAFRAGGARERVRFAIDRCTLGVLLVAATDRGVCAVSLGDEPAPLVEALRARFPRAERVARDAAFSELVAAVVALVDDPAAGASVPLDIRGTAFQLRVWGALRAIPPGETVSYQQLAEAIGAPTASRAVARACGANPVAVAIPCHRVVRKDGALSGYRWGAARKRALLSREAEERE